jgi:hypothetical protein
LLRIHPSELFAYDRGEAPPIGSPLAAMLQSHDQAPPNFSRLSIFFLFATVRQKWI